MSITVTGATAETLSPTVEIKNGPCITCKFWIDKKCQIDKQPDEALDCSYYAHGT